MDRTATAVLRLLGAGVLVGSLVGAADPSAAAPATHVFADVATGDVRPHRAGVLGHPVPLRQVTSVGVGDAGEVLAVTCSGALYRIGSARADGNRRERAPRGPLA